MERFTSRSWHPFVTDGKPGSFRPKPRHNIKAQYYRLSFFLLTRETQACLSVSIQIHVRHGEKSSDGAKKEESMTGTLRVGIATILLMVSMAAAALAQSASTITGTVKDSSDAVLPGATVILVNPGQAISQTALTNPDGVFVFPQLPPGTYTISVELPGFKKTEKSDVILPTAAKVNVGDFVLAVGNVSETVTVEADTARLQIQSESGERSDLLTGKQLRNIGFNGRNVIDLAKAGSGSDLRWRRLGQRSLHCYEHHREFHHQRHAQYDARIYRRRRDQLQPRQQHRGAGLGQPRRARRGPYPDLELLRPSTAGRLEGSSRSRPAPGATSTTGPGVTSAATTASTPTTSSTTRAMSRARCIATTSTVGTSAARSRWSARGNCSSSSTRNITTSWFLSSRR